MKKNKYRKRKISLSRLARESIHLAKEDASLSEIRDILDKKWLVGAKNLGLNVIYYSDKEFVDEKSGIHELSPFLRRQLLSAFGDISKYRSGYTFSENGDEIVLIELKCSNKRGEELRIVEVCFLPLSEVEL